MMLAVIPARLGSTRLPGKPLRLLGGRPLVVRVWERLTTLALADRCVIATDSEEVAAVARAAGAECVITSDAHPSGTDRVAEVARRTEYARYDAILNVQGDEPFVQREAVSGATAVVASGRFPLGTAACPAPASALTQPNVVKVVAADDGRAMYFSRAGIPYRRGDGDSTVGDGLVRQHIGVYAYTRDALLRWVSLPEHPLERLERLEQLRPLAAGIAMGVAPVKETPLAGIDTEEDLALASARWDDFRRAEG